MDMIYFGNTNINSTLNPFDGVNNNNNHIAASNSSSEDFIDLCDYLVMEEDDHNQDWSQSTESSDNNNNVINGSSQILMNEENTTTSRVVEVREKITIRTRSTIEIMDDGYKWRKYGKKFVKNSPNPRNYYKCSGERCGVKKRVERDRQDSSYVLTTYEGLHNHDTPSYYYYTSDQSQQQQHSI